MKYWVYKESRILGPFDKEGVSGLPGLDAGTLVCTGDPAGAAWVPAGEMSDLAGVAARYDGPAYDELPSNASLLDQLQIDSAGLVGDDEFPGALSQEMFQDAGFKKTFSDVLSDRVSDEELRKSRDTIADLTDKLAAMYRHVSELEAAQTDLARRLAAKDAEFQAGVPAPAPEPEAPAAGLPAKTFLSPAPPPLPGGPPPVAGAPAQALPSAEWPEAKAPGSFPSFGGAAPFAPAAGAPPLPPAIPAPPAAPETGLPAIPSFAAAGAPPADAIAPVPDAPAAPAEAPRGFGKPKSFKVVPVVKSFKVLGATDAVPADANPVAEFKFEQPAAEAAAVPATPPPAPIPEPIAPVTLAPIMPAPAPIPVMAPAPVPAPAPVTNPFTLPARPEPAAPVAAVPTPAPPPNTLSRSQPVPDLTAGDLGATAQSAPPETMARSGAAAPAAAEDSGVAARFAKPEPAPPTGEIKKPARNNKPFLIGGAVLVTLLAILGVIFMRQPKEDLKQMATLDDGKAPIGLPADDGAAAPPPIVKPKMAQEPAPAPAPAPGPSAEHVAAINTVKDFPLDGGRGTVGRWLQYSYTASPNAGAEEWNASTTGEGTVLVEYRLVPGASGGTGALYLFEADANGLVMGKNLEARQMLAGGAPPEAPMAKPKAAKKAGPKRAPKKRRPVVEEPKEVPLLPLPDSGELRPPAEDDGSFGSDTINSGL